MSLRRLVGPPSTHAALLDVRVDIDEVFADPDQRAALQAGTLLLPLRCRWIRRWSGCICSSVESARGICRGLCTAD
jgi:hypothetical protein